jgi:hypothetical protein
MSMAMNFHERYARDDINPPSERSTGLAFAALALLVAILWRQAPVVPWVALAGAAVLSGLSLSAPQLLKRLNNYWFRLGLLLHRIVTPLVMFVIFVLVFVPAGLLMRLWHDPLRAQRAGTDATYWIERKSNAQQDGSMINQF